MLYCVSGNGGLSNRHSCCTYPTQAVSAFMIFLLYNMLYVSRKYCTSRDNGMTTDERTALGFGRGGLQKHIAYSRYKNNSRITVWVRMTLDTITARSILRYILYISNVIDSRLVFSLEKAPGNDIQHRGSSLLMSFVYRKRNPKRARVMECLPIWKPSV